MIAQRQRFQHGAPPFRSKIGVRQIASFEDPEYIQNYSARSVYPKKAFPLSTAVVLTMARSSAPFRDMSGESFDSAEDYGVPVVRMDGSGIGASVPGTALAAGSIVIDKCLSRIFVAAYLLTGSAIDAEGVTLESIQQLDINAAPNGCLPWKAIAATVTRGNLDSERPRDETPTALPVELLRVLRLPPRLRRCFVLRFLMAMPRQYCADLLRIDAEEVDANSCLAAQHLASTVVSDALRE